MFRLTFLLLAVIGIAMLVVDDKAGAERRAVAATPRVVDPALTATPKVASAPHSGFARPASVDRLLGVEPAPVVPRPAEAAVEAVAAVVEPALDETGSAAPRRRDYMSVNDEVAARASAGAERAAAAAGATEAAAVREGVAAAMADATVAIVTGTRVNVRSGPSTNYGVVGQVSYGEATEVLSSSENGWVRIRIQGDGIEGYIAERFLDGSGL